MTARDWYGLAIRLAGLVFFMYAIFDLTHLVTLLVGVNYPSQYPAATLEITIAVWIALGLILTLGADFLTRVVYGPK